MRKYLLITLLILSCHADEWKNWAQNQQCRVTLATPHTINELRAIIQKAKEERKKVHAIGSGHSWSNIVCVQDGYLINTDNLDKIISTDMKKKQVTVQAGIKLKDLNAYLAHIGWCLPNQAAVTEQSLAGNISTATHGSGKTGTFASFITNVQLLTAAGKLQHFSSTEHADLFPAVRTSIGSLGIMTELTVQCEQLFKVRREMKTIDFEEMLKTYKHLLKNNDFMQFYWNVAGDRVDITIHNRVTDGQKGKNIGYSYEMLTGSLGVIYFEEEIAIPLTKFVDAFRAARSLVQKEYKTNPIFFGILCRFVSADKKNLLSPADDRDVVFLSITTNGRNYESFYKKFYHLMLQYDGRPHWGKLNYLTKKDVQQLYGKNLDQFITIRKQLDPDGMFLNEFGNRIFD